MRLDLYLLKDFEGDELLNAMEFPFDGDEMKVIGWMYESRLMSYLNQRRFLLSANVLMTNYEDIVFENALKALDPYLEKYKHFKSRCPKEGEFYGYKFVVMTKNYRYLDQFDIGIVKLRIPKDAKRVSPYSGKGKCRCDKAFVEEIWKMHACKGYVDEQYDKIACSTFDTSCSLHYYKNDDGSRVLADGGLSAYRSNFKYKVGEMIESGVFNDDRWTECSDGIHFFMSPEEAEKYAMNWLYQL